MGVRVAYELGQGYLGATCLVVGVLAEWEEVVSGDKGLGVPIGDACEAEAGLDWDVRGRERAEGLLDFLMVGKVLPEECFSSGPRAPGRRVEV